MYDFVYVAPAVTPSTSHAGDVPIHVPHRTFCVRMAVGVCADGAVNSMELPSFFGGRTLACGSCVSQLLEYV
jgi:hypothetical protein